MNNSPSILPTGAAAVTLEIEIEASLSATWQAMIGDVGQWWRADFLVCEGSKGMNLEPKIGGLLFETSQGGGTGFVWGQIIRFEPNEHLAFTAQIVPPWGGPAQSVVQISLTESGEAGQKRTKLTLNDSLIGYLTEETLDNVKAGWQMLFGEGGLKSHVESQN